MTLTRLAKSYVFWTYDRGSLHYDVLVTAILIFMFGAPFVINFKDRPVETIAKNRSEVLVKEAGHVGDSSRFIYEIRADNLPSHLTDAQLNAAILHVVEPISGEVTLERWEALKDEKGNIIAYDAWVLR